MTAEADAARFAGVLWAAIRTAGGPRPGDRRHRHFAGAYPAGWVASLPLPLGDRRPAGQPVALLDPRHDAEFERHCDPAALARACAVRPRTQVTEDIGHGQPHTWHALTARHLSRLSASAIHVTCSIFRSQHGDETFGAHGDAWYGAVAQVAGAKHWLIGEALLDGSGTPVPDLTTTAGDILLIPKLLPHLVSTPASPGHSVHLAFAIDRDSRHP
jgi:Cupin superfamily protein